jgi:hypothetical protein
MRPLSPQLFSLFFALAISFGSAELIAAESDTKLLATPRSGDIRVEQRGKEYWIASTQGPARANRVPVESPEHPPVEFYFSPDHQWLFTLPDGGSCIREGSLFHRDLANGEIAAIPSFDLKAWTQVAKLKAISSNFAEEGACHMMKFGGWSLDSIRLLIGMRGGHGKTEMEAAYLYFNTQTKRFELTPYLRKLNEVSNDGLGGPMPCTEPSGTLPPLAQVKERHDKLDAELNAKYAEQMKTRDKNGADRLRFNQRDWLKSRDAGLKLYLPFVNPSEREIRRLQYLGDGTATLLEQPPEFWHERDTWLF